MTPSIKLTFLGTGTSVGIPMIGCPCVVCKSNNPKDKRLRVSALVEMEDFKLLIDIGPDFRYQALRAGITDLDAIFITHGHRDHTAGLDDVRALNFIHHKPMEIYCSEETLVDLKKQFSYVFEDTGYENAPKVNVNIISDEDFKIKNNVFKPIQVLHGGEYKVQGIRIQNVVFITDANFISDTEIEKIKHCDVLVLNALRHEKHYSHFTLQEAIEMVQKIAPKKAYFIHMSHQLGLHDEIQKTLPENIFLAYDNLTIEC